jgi:integration host factor subunit beta
MGADQVVKCELIDHVSAKCPNMRRRDVDRMVDAIFESITAALVRGDRVEIRGFGVFSVRRRTARRGRNPRTGENVSVGPKTVPFFKTGKEMRDRLNSTGTLRYSERGDAREGALADPRYPVRQQAAIE